MKREALPETGWHPVGFDSETRDLTWFHLPGERFHEPFFEDTLRKHRRQAPRKTTSLDVFREDVPGGCDPCAIFFHASRCGSTLVTRILGQVPGCRAIAEPPVVDALLQANAADDLAVRGLIRAMGRPETGIRHTFLKLDSWHVAYAARVRRIFPETPCFFLYREPAAILLSHRRERGSQMVPGMIDSRILGIDPDTVDPADLDGYAVRVLSSILREAIHGAENHGIIPIAYSQLPRLIWEDLWPALGLPKAEWEAAIACSLQHSKHPHQVHMTAEPTPPGESVPAALIDDFIRLETLRDSLQENFFNRKD